MKKTILAAAVLVVGAGLSWAGSSDSEFASRLGALRVASPAKALAAARKEQPDAGLIVPSVGAPLTQLPPDALARLKSKAEEMYRKHGTDGVDSAWGFGRYGFEVGGHALPNGAFDITSVALEIDPKFSGSYYSFTISMDGKIAGNYILNGGRTLEDPSSQKALKQVLEHYIGSVQ